MFSKSNDGTIQNSTRGFITSVIHQKNWLLGNWSSLKNVRHTCKSFDVLWFSGQCLVISTAIIVFVFIFIILILIIFFFSQLWVNVEITAIIIEIISANGIIISIISSVTIILLPYHNQYSIIVTYTSAVLVFWSMRIREQRRSASGLPPAGVSRGDTLPTLFLSSLRPASRWASAGRPSPFGVPMQISMKTARFVVVSEGQYDHAHHTHGREENVVKKPHFAATNTSSRVYLGATASLDCTVHDITNESVSPFSFLLFLPFLFSFFVLC